MYNKAILIGRIGQDPELRYTPSGTAVTNFSIATNRKWRGKDGQLNEETTWHDIVCWAKTAEFIGEYGGKGRLVFVEGEIRKRDWEDNSGNKRTSVEINARNVQLLDRKPDGAPSGGGRSRPKPKPSSGGGNDTIEDTEDDVPF